MTHQYHDAIDRREAKERAQQAEIEPLCTCLEKEGDDDNCPIHGMAAWIEREIDAEDAEHDAQAHESQERDRDIADLRGGL